MAKKGKNNNNNNNNKFILFDQHVNMAKTDNTGYAKQMITLTVALDITIFSTFTFNIHYFVITRLFNDTVR